MAMRTPFGEILMRAVQAIPSAVGGALAAKDGEIVDSFCEWEHDEWALFTAHSGVLFHHTRSALHTFHFGDVQFIYIQLDKMALAMHNVVDGYFALMAIDGTGEMRLVEQTLCSAASMLCEEMG